jgi:hypothetical protein
MVPDLTDTNKVRQVFEGLTEGEFDLKGLMNSTDDMEKTLMDLGSGDFTRHMKEIEFDFANMTMLEEQMKDLRDFDIKGHMDDAIGMIPNDTMDFGNMEFSKTFADINIDLNNHTQLENMFRTL